MGEPRNLVVPCLIELVLLVYKNISCFCYIYIKSDIEYNNPDVLIQQKKLLVNLNIQLTKSYNPAP